MSNAEKITAAVEQSNLVDAEVVDQLRSKLERTPDMGLRAAVKWLVAKRHITTSQGGRLLASIEASAVDEDDFDLKPLDAGDVRQTRELPGASGQKGADDDDDDLELIPLDGATGTGATGTGATGTGAAGNDAPAKSPSRGATAAAGSSARWAGTPTSSTKAPAPKAAPPKAVPAKGAPARAEPTKAASKTARAKSEPKVSARSASAPTTGRSKAAPAAPQAPPNGQDGGDGMTDLFGATGLEHAAAMAGHDALAPTDRKNSKPRRHEEDFGSPLIMILLTSLLIVIAIGAGAYWALNRYNADKEFTQAEKAYNAGSYVDAAKRYGEYIKAYPNDSHVSEAKVHKAMAEMRLAVQGHRDATKALAEAKVILEEIANEEKFADARKELAALLPEIAQRLADQAAEKLDPELVTAAHEAIQLVEKHVPKAIRPNQKMSVIAGSLADTQHRMGRGSALDKAVADIQEVIKAGRPHDAYPIRKQLIKSYPELRGNETLRDAVLSVSQAERAGVKFVEQEQAAEPADAKSPVQAEVVPFDIQGGPAPGVKGEVLFVLAGGAAYGLDAETGKALWRRFVGFDTDFVPQPISIEPACDALLVDSVRHEVLRVAATNGELRWRYVVGEPFDAHPVITSERLSIATRSGRLIHIDPASGKSPGYVQLPQGLRVGPSFDARGLTYYQIGETANLFVLASADEQCKEVFYLGHEPDAIRVPPIVVGPYVFIAENRGASDAVLRLVLTDNAGIPVNELDPLPLAGHVHAPMLLDGRRLVVTTDRGAIYTFEVSPPDPGPPLSDVARKPDEKSAPYVRYPLLKEASLFVAGMGFTRYDIQAAREKLEARWQWDETDSFLETPRIIGEVAFHVRRKGKAPNVLVSAAHVGDGTRIWQTTLAAPLASVPAPDAKGNLTLLNSAGSLFDLATGKLSGRSGLKAVGSTNDLSGDFSAGAGVVAFDGDHLMLVGGSGEPRARIAQRDPSERLRWLTLPDPLGSTPIGFAGGLLVPGRLGQVFVIDPKQGQNLIEPFQPRLVAGAEYVWSAPVKLNDQEVLLADGGEKLYRLGVSKQGTPRLVNLGEADLAGVTSPIVVLDQTAFVVDGKDELRSFQLPELMAGPSRPLEGGCAWGPLSVAGRVLVATNGGELLAFDDSRGISGGGLRNDSGGGLRELWRVPLTHGPLTGAPLSDGDAYLLATLGGVVYRLAADTGAELGMVEIGEPLATGPVALDGVSGGGQGARLVLAGHDGTLLVIAGP